MTQSHSNTSILPNTKSNRLTYHVSHQGTSSNIPFIKLVGIQTKISCSRQGSIQYFHFTEYKTKQVHISCLQQRTSRDKFKLFIYRTSRQGSFQYFNLPNLKPNRFPYHVLYQGTSSNFPYIKVVGKQTKITFSRQRSSIQYFHFTKYKTKQVQISCLPQGIQGTSSNLPFIKLRDMGHCNTFIFSNMKLNRFTYHVSHQGTSRKMVNLHIYQTCNHIS